MKKLLFLWFSFTFIAYSQQEYILNANTNGQTITTCQGIFLDSGGANDNYGINENYTITICPETQENFLQVTFSQFQLENNWDRLYIHNGNSVSDPLVLSSNGPGNGSCNTQAGGWWNNQLEGQAITSTHSSGCLTFRFCSDDNVNQGGWVANVNCVSGIDCPNPSNITATNIQPSSVDVNWTENGSATSWEVIISPLGSQIPSNAVPINPANVYSSLPVNISNLLENTDYVIFVRAICDINQETASISNWSASTPFSTSTTPLGCGGTFTDSGGPTNNYSNNENNTTTICPDTPNSFVQVIFTQFQLETNWDKLYIHNGSSVNDPLILSPNGPGLGACNDQSGGWWGNQLQGQTILSSNPSGCLTFRFCSDASVTQAGWIAVVNCISAENSHIISVQPFLDSNNNGIKDPNEPVFAFGELNYEVNNDGINQLAFSPNGFFTFVINEFSEPTVYDFSYNIFENYLPYFSLTPPATQSVTVTQVGLTEIFYPIVQTNPYEDLRINLIPLNAPRAGFLYHLKLIYSNDGPSIVNNGTVTLIKDPALTFTNISDTNAVQNSDGFILNFTDLQPFENRVVNISFQVPNIPIVSINQLITTDANIVPIELDVTPDNNSTRLIQGVIAAYDPNDKTESHGRQIIFEDFDVATDELTYTIRFENEGNAEAFDVRITDTLNAQIDETSVRMVDASHNYVLTRIDNDLEWFFKDINLPPSVPNTLIGHGHVTFKVKLNPGIQVGSIVPNFASIYFDTNPPIVTEVFETEFVEPLSTNQFNSNFSIYPNPANQVVNIQSKNLINNWQILDIQGKVIVSNVVEPATQLQLDLSQMKSGVYILQLSTNEGEAKFKLIKN